MAALQHRRNKRHRQRAIRGQEIAAISSGLSPHPLASLALATGMNLNQIAEDFIRLNEAFIELSPTPRQRINLTAVAHYRAGQFDAGVHKHLGGEGD